ncbi:hypothetical protein [Catenulispora rubra]|uniref:hypothetical protein n=1 Tax=Catenulispora rubra TaxID=280293 RepID=UPI0018924D1B|nr:hypothetical protein [Catenulispora rubra]
MTRVWPIDELDGRFILAEWMLTHPAGGDMMIRLWDGNQTVSIYLADALPLPTEADSSTDYLHGFRQVVNEILPGYITAGWAVDESFLADGIDAADAEFSPLRCPECAFTHPWWCGAEESCQICDTAIDLDWLPYSGLNGMVEAGEYDSARNLVRDLSHTLAVGEQLLTELPEGKQRTNIAALMGPARTAHRGATARLRAVLALPSVAAATEAALPAVLAVIAHGTDVAGWLAGVLATAAAQLGSVEAVTANRPGSWEADLVHRLVAGTVGWDDEHLDDYLPAPTPSGDDGQDDDAAEAAPEPLAFFSTAGGAVVNVADYPHLPNTFSTICTACGPQGLHSYLPELKDSAWQTAVDDATSHAESCTKEAGK